MNWNEILFIKDSLIKKSANLILEKKVDRKRKAKGKKNEVKIWEVVISKDTFYFKNRNRPSFDKKKG